MKVILLEDIPSIGAAGAVVEVTGGYGRNFLFPKGLAIPATPGNMKGLEKTRAEIAKKQNRLRGEAEMLAKKLEATPLTMSGHAGEDGRLHGSITSQDIADALAAKDLAVDKRKIHLDEPIRVIGSHTVKIKLAPGVEASLQVEVAPAS
jgi:large subunit ribosomal protein L9